MPRVFSPFAIPDASYEVRLGYGTQMHESDDGTEQRAWRRLIPTRSERFTVQTLYAHRTGWLEALAYQPDEQWIVPYWPHGALLTANASLGATALSLDTTDRQFAVGGYAVLWTDEGTCEAVTIAAVGGASLTVSATTLAWSAGAYVIPGRLARYDTDLAPRRPNPATGTLPVAFRMEHGTDPGVALSASPAVFDFTPYTEGNQRESLARLVDRIESDTYTFADYPRRTHSIGSRPFRVWLDSRSAVADLEAWFHGIRGRCKPFWLPTRQADLVVTAGLGTASLTIRSCGYTALLFPDPARTHLACIEPDGTITHREVTAAVDNGDGTETLTLDDTAPAATSLVSFLLYGRLASDDLLIRWRKLSFADAELGFVELPPEVAELA